MNCKVKVSSILIHVQTDSYIAISDICLTSSVTFLPGSGSVGSNPTDCEYGVLLVMFLLSCFVLCLTSESKLNDRLAPFFRNTIVILYVLKVGMLAQLVIYWFDSVVVNGHVLVCMVKKVNVARAGA